MPLAKNANASDDVERLAAALELDIIFGRLKPRERLVEDDLMSRFGTKRHVVRSALQHLEKLGIVVRLKNRGAMVRDFEPAEVEQLYDLRATLQQRAAEILPLPASHDLIGSLEDLHRRHSAAVEAGDVPTAFELNNAFHETLFNACGNRYLAEAIHHYAWLAHAIRSYRMANPALLEQARLEHGEMIEAIRRCDRASLVRLCVEHINPSKEAYLLSLGFQPGSRVSQLGASAFRDMGSSAAAQRFPPG